MPNKGKLTKSLATEIQQIKLKKNNNPKKFTKAFDKYKKQEEHKKPLYYVHLKSKCKRCLFCSTNRETKPINKAGGRKLFFENKILIYPNQHYICKKCNKISWKQLKIHQSFRKTLILSSSKINLIRSYLTTLQKIIDLNEFIPKRKRGNVIHIDTISPAQCKRLCRIPIEHIKDMASKAGIEFKHCFIFWYYLGSIDSFEKCGGLYGGCASTIGNWFKTARLALHTWAKTINNKKRVNREYIKQNTSAFARIALSLDEKPDAVPVMMDSFSIPIQKPSKLHENYRK